MSEGTEIWDAQAAFKRLEARVAELERLLTTRVKTVPAQTVDLEALRNAKPGDIIPLVEGAPVMTFAEVQEWHKKADEIAQAREKLAFEMWPDFKPSREVRMLTSDIAAQIVQAILGEGDR